MSEGRHAPGGAHGAPKSATLALNPADQRQLRLARTLGISESRLLGQEPAETHRGFDVNGNPCPITEAHIIRVEREPEFTERDLLRFELLEQVEAETCGGCGYHKSLATDENWFTLQADRCPVCEGYERSERVRSAALAEWRSESSDPPPGAVHPGDGERTYMRPMSPSEIEAHLAQEVTRGNTS